MNLSDLALSTDSRTTSTTSWTISLPLSASSGRAVQDNDVMWVFVAVTGSTNASAPTGWVRVTDQNMPIGGGPGPGKYAAYRRVFVSGDTGMTLTWGSGVTGVALVLIIPSPTGLSGAVALSISQPAPPDDPAPGSFADCIGGLRLFVPSGTGAVSQENAPNNWSFLTDISPSGLYSIGAWGHLGVGEVDDFELDIPSGEFAGWAFQADWQFELDSAPSGWWVGVVGWGAGGEPPFTMEGDFDGGAFFGDISGSFDARLYWHTDSTNDGFTLGGEAPGYLNVGDFSGYLPAGTYEITMTGPDLASGTLEILQYDSGDSLVDSAAGSSPLTGTFTVSDADKVYFTGETTADSVPPDPLGSYSIVAV